MKRFDKKTGKNIFVESGVVHNPKPSTPRGKRRHEKRDENQKARVAALWGDKS